MGLGKHGDQASDKRYLYISWFSTISKMLVSRNIWLQGNIEREIGMSNHLKRICQILPKIVQLKNRWPIVSSKPQPTKHKVANHGISITTAQASEKSIYPLVGLVLLLKCLWV